MGKTFTFHNNKSTYKERFENLGQPVFEDLSGKQIQI